MVCEYSRGRKSKMFVQRSSYSRVQRVWNRLQTNRCWRITWKLTVVKTRIRVTCVWSRWPKVAVSRFTRRPTTVRYRIRVRFVRNHLHGTGGVWRFTRGRTIETICCLFELINITLYVCVFRVLFIIVMLLHDVEMMWRKSKTTRIVLLNTIKWKRKRVKQKNNRRLREMPTWSWWINDLNVKHATGKPNRQYRTRVIRTSTVSRVQHSVFAHVSCTNDEVIRSRRSDK